MLAGACAAVVALGASAANAGPRRRLSCRLAAGERGAAPDLESPAPPTSTPSPSPTVSDTLTTTVVRAVTVHSGSTARVRYRADDTAGGTVTIDVLVTTRAGDVVKRLVTGRVTAVGVDRVVARPPATAPAAAICGRARSGRGRPLRVERQGRGAARARAAAAARAHRPRPARRLCLGGPARR